MLVKIEQVRKAAKGKINEPNANSVLVALNKFGSKVGLDQPHRLAHYFSQLMHESGSFKYDREIWGPTPAQKRYDTRVDLGNTPEKDGDGELYAGRTGIQLTGKGNYARFTAWVQKHIEPNAPDFVKHPELVNTDPWEGLVPIWFWTVGNSTGKSLNVYADQNNSEMITRKINGGLNGYADRLEYYDRIGLVLLGYRPGDYLLFQKDANGYRGQIDGEAGPKTRAAIHMRLVMLTGRESLGEAVQEAPVVAIKPVDAGKPATLPVGAGKPAVTPSKPIDAPIGKAKAGGIIATILAGLAAAFYGLACHLPTSFIEWAGFAAKCTGN